MSRATDSVGQVQSHEPRYNNMRKNFSAIVGYDIRGGVIPTNPPEFDATGTCHDHGCQTRTHRQPSSVGLTQMAEQGLPWWGSSASTCRRLEH